MNRQGDATNSNGTSPQWHISAMTSTAGLCHEQDWQGCAAAGNHSQMAIDIQKALRAGAGGWMAHM